MAKSKQFIPTLPKQKVTNLLRKINASKINIAKERDNLREYANDLKELLFDDAEIISEDCDEAFSYLESAGDSLSKFL